MSRVAMTTDIAVVGSTNLVARQTASSGAVAVLLCVHAGARPDQFDEALASMRRQSYPDLRMLIYCDGPLTPALEDALAKHVRLNDGRDHVIRAEGSKGLPTGLNTLIDHALSELDIAFLARMDADDISMPNRIEAQVQFFAEHPIVAVAGTWCIEFTRPNVPAFYKEMPTEHEDLTGFMLFRSPFNHPTVMFRRTVFEQGYRYDPRLNLMQDYDLWSRLVIAGFMLGNIAEFLLWFRINEDFYMRRAGIKRAVKEVRMRINYAKMMKKHKFSHYLKYGGLIAVRLAPVSVKRFLYKNFRDI